VGCAAAIATHRPLFILLSVPRTAPTILAEAPEHVVVAGRGVVVLDLRMVCIDAAARDVDPADATETVILRPKAAGS
jgi:hypothetical protein